MNTKTSTLVRKIEIQEIMEMIPHRYPFLLIDQVDITSDIEAVGKKSVTINEPFFQGHFPKNPVMPGVLIVESMAQTSAVLVVEITKENPGNIVYFMSIDRARFRKPVVPGDQISLFIKKLKNRGNVWKFEGSAFVEGNLMAEAKFSAMIME